MQAETWQFEMISGDEYTLVEFVSRSKLSQDEVQELIDCGAIAPIDAKAAPPRFNPLALEQAQAAARLREELAIDLHAAAVALRLLQRIRELESQLHALQVRSLR